MIKPENSRISHHTTLNNFEKFCQQKFGRSKELVIEEFKSVEKYVIFTTIQNWIQWNIDNGINPSSIITWFSNLNTYFYYKGLEFSQREIKENLDFPKRLQEDLYGVQAGDIERILKVASTKYRRIIMAQCSTLMREGEMMQIQKKHLIFKKDRIVIKIPAKFTKLKKARMTVLNREATQINAVHISELDDEDLVWGTNTVQYDTTNYENAIRRYCKKVGLFERYDFNGRNKITSHSFRAFGVTKISRHDQNFAKMLAGQKGYLLQYDRLSDDEKLELYVKFEKDLTVDDSARKQVELEEKKKEVSELQGYKDILENQEQIIKNAVKAEIERLNKEGNCKDDGNT